MALDTAVASPFTTAGIVWRAVRLHSMYQPVTMSVALDDDSRSIALSYGSWTLRTGAMAMFDPTRRVGDPELSNKETRSPQIGEQLAILADIIERLGVVLVVRCDLV
jgi:hypothetical protein